MLSVIDRFIPNRYGRQETMSAVRSARSVSRSATVPLYQRIFPDFGELDVAIPAGFEDSSSVDDGMPSFTSETLCALLMIDYADPQQRLGPEAPRFALFDLDELKRLSPNALLFETDDYQQAMCLIEQLR